MQRLADLIGEFCPGGWYGVCCNDDGTTIIGLELKQNNLSGSIPYTELSKLVDLTAIDVNLNSLKGTISAEVGKLSKLWRFKIYGNDITGTIPSEFGQIRNLSQLILGNNSLNGTIPWQLGNCSAMFDFKLFYNKLTGPIPASFGNLKNLKELWLGENLLTGAIPSELGRLTNLVHLWFEQNHLSGTIPWQLGNLSNAIEVSLQHNNLVGTIPAELGNLVNVQTLYLGYNSLNGTIPAELGKLTKVLTLGVTNNSLIGPIPAELGQLTNVEVLSLDQGQLTGTIPWQLGNCSKLTQLSVLHNHLVGTIPAELGNLTELQQLWLGYNSLSGTIPGALGKLLNLQQLHLGQNFKIGGSIPKELRGLASIQILIFTNNLLTSTIPIELCELTTLTQLYLDGNKLIGTIPSEIGQLKNLIDLGVSDNNLVGVIPSNLSGAAKLAKAYLYANHFTGSIPLELSNLTYLTILNLSSNRLSGFLPRALPPNLVYLDLSNNRLSGPVSFALPNLNKLNYLLLYSNRLTGPIPPDLLFRSRTSVEGVLLQSNNFVGNLSFLTSAEFPNLRYIDVSSNNIDGTIPAEIFALPNLTSVALVKNCFSSGIIPEKVCEARSLQVLALDGLATSRSCRLVLVPGGLAYTVPRSYVAAALPSCIWNMTNLTTLHVSGNEIPGKLPITVSPSLMDLSLAHNRITGFLYSETFASIKTVDVSFNLVRGSLPSISDRTQNLKTSSFSCNHNLISGGVPSWVGEIVNNEGSIDILEGNILSCTSNVQALHKDPSWNSYVCASDDLNPPLYLWAAVFACAFVAIPITKWWRRNRDEIPQADCSEQDQHDLMSSRLAEGWRAAVLRYWSFLRHGFLKSRFPYERVAGTETLKQFMAHSFICCAIAAIFCVLLLQPLFIGLKESTHIYSTYFQQFTWVISAAFLSGWKIGAAIVVLWIVLVASICGLTLTVWRKIPSAVSAKDATRDQDWKIIALLILFTILDVAVIVFINAAYVSYYTSTAVDKGLKLSVQVIFALSKTTINSLVVLGVDRLSLKDTENSVLLGSGLLLFNNIITPCVVTVLTDSQCFLNVFTPYSEIEATYVLQGFQVWDIPSAQYVYEDRVLSTTFTPPFAYDYQCGSALIRQYIPVVFYTALLFGALKPLCMLGLSQVSKRRFPDMLSRLVPGVLWTKDTQERNQRLFPAVQTVTILINQTAQLLVFGFLCPPIAVVLTLCVALEGYTWTTVIDRYKSENTITTQDQCPLEEACSGLYGGIQGAVYCMLVTWALLSMCVVFDIVAGETGWAKAIWVPVLVIFAVIVVVIVARARNTEGGVGERIPGEDAEEEMDALEAPDDRCGSLLAFWSSRGVRSPLTPGSPRITLPAGYHAATIKIDKDQVELAALQQEDEMKA